MGLFLGIGQRGEKLPSAFFRIIPHIGIFPHFSAFFRIFLAFFFGIWEIFGEYMKNKGPVKVKSQGGKNAIFEKNFKNLFFQEFFRHEHTQNAQDDILSPLDTFLNKNCDVVL